MQTLFSQRLKKHLLISLAGALLIVLIVLSTLGLVAHRISAPGQMAVHQQNSMLIGEQMQRQFVQAIRVGIPLSQLVGTKDSFLAELRQAPQVAFLALLDAHGRVLTMATQPDFAHLDAFDLSQDDENFWIGRLGIYEEQNAGTILIGISRSYLDQTLRDSLLELGTGIIVALVLTSELLRLLLTHSAIGSLLRLEWLLEGLAKGKLNRRTGLDANTPDPAARLSVKLDNMLDTMRLRLDKLRISARVSTEVSAWEAHYPLHEPQVPRKQLVAVVRLMVFLMALSEELCRPYFAVFAASVAVKSPWFSSELLTALPIGAFMLAWALAQPLGPLLVPRLGVGRGLFIGGLMAAAGLALTAQAQSPAWLSLYRILTGLGYGLFLIVSQALVTTDERQESRARDMAEIAAALIAAGICGPMIGGALADKLGFVSSFLVCAGFALLSGLIASLVLSNKAAGNTSQFNWNSAVTLGRAWSFMRLVLLSAFPAKFAATAVLILLVPLYLHTQGYPTAMIGQVLMLYFMAFVLVAPYASRLANTRGLGRRLIICGGLGSGMAILLSASLHQGWAIALGCGLFGACQALISGPQLASVKASIRKILPEMPVEAGLGVFRLLERLGCVVAPFACSALIAFLGLMGTMLLLSLILAVSSIALALSGHNEFGD